MMPESVLVVDDDPLQLELLKSCLSDLGIKNTILVSNVQDAVAFLKGPSAFGLDLIISDICMPPPDGVDLVKFLASQAVATPLILMSGSTEELLRSVAQFVMTTRVELVGTLAKPFAKQDLECLLRPSQPQLTASTEDHPRIVRKSALVVDDDSILFETAAAMLRKLGFSEVMHAPSVAAASRHLKSGTPVNLILLDLNLPGTDGVEFMIDLRQSWSEIPIAIVSSAHETVRNAAYHLGKAYGLDVRWVLSKPVTIAKLEEVLR